MNKLLLQAALALSGWAAAEEPIDVNAGWAIRREEIEHSQVMQILHKLTDRYGPRVTGSPGHEAAAEWAANQLRAWGLKNVRLEPWEFGHPGWSNERASGYLMAPVHGSLTFKVLAWTPSTNGTVTGGVVQMDPPKFPTKDELNAWLDANREKVRGKMVLMGKAALTPVSFAAVNKRLDDAEVRARFDPVSPTPGPSRQRPQTPEGKLSVNQVNALLDPWLVANGALMRLNDAGLDHGLVRAFANRSYDTAKAVPTVVLRNEDFGRIERLLADGEPVELAFDIANQIYPKGVTTYNVVGEIPGSDNAGEFVLIGAHLDSWHSATGATDNAIGSSMMMEAARVIASLGKAPRRTIRVALWSGEEQGLLGSLAYVKQHFGSFEEPKPDYQKLSAYINIDSGTGRVRGANVFGPADAAAVVRAALAPFEDLGVAGASAGASRNLGGTDSTSFNAAGLPGIGLNQDPIEYGSFTWHTNLDTYERIIPDDARKSVTVIAATAWHLANRPTLVPRFAKEKMPPPPKPEENQ